MHKFRFITLIITLLTSTIYANANSFEEAKIDKEEKGFLYIQTSVYTKHFNPKPNHNNNQELIAIDYNYASGWHWGGATFRNSFRQRTVYAYGGKRFELEKTPLYARVTRGLIQGYHGKYRNKIPMNGLGVAPAIIPSLGVQVNRVSSEILFLGFNAAMINVGFKI